MTWMVLILFVEAGSYLLIDIRPRLTLLMPQSILLCQSACRQPSMRLATLTRASMRVLNDRSQMVVHPLRQKGLRSGLFDSAWRQLDSPLLCELKHMCFGISRATIPTRQPGENSGLVLQILDLDSHNTMQTAKYHADMVLLQQGRMA